MATVSSQSRMGSSTDVAPLSSSECGHHIAAGVEEMEMATASVNGMRLFYELSGTSEVPVVCPA